MLNRTLSWALGLSAALAAQDPLLQTGPLPTRDMFPPAMLTHVYEPAPPDVLDRGRWSLGFLTVRANILEFSDIIKETAPRDAQGRIAVTRDFVQSEASRFKGIPLVFFFDEEVLRSTLRWRCGLGMRSELYLEWAFQSHSGGFLDEVIEGFHRLGFAQALRDRIARSEVALVLIQDGELSFYSDQKFQGKPQDPVVGFTRALVQRPDLAVALNVQVKVPLTEAYPHVQAGFDTGLQLTARWCPRPAHALFAGVGCNHVGNGSPEFQKVGFKNRWGGHLGYEYRGWRGYWPFLQLYALGGCAVPRPHMKWDKPSLQHDLGFRWKVLPRTIFTFRYMNNITHNENTADMGLGLGVSVGF